MKIPVILSALCCVKALAADSPFIEYGIVPDVIDAPPEDELQVEFANNQRVSYGTELRPTQVRERPSLSWTTAASGDLYSVFLTDPDAEAVVAKRGNALRATPREYLHYMVENVPQNDISKGTTVVPYMGSAPPKGTGLHRYTLLVYKQPGYINSSAVPSRAKFSVRTFAHENQLGEPVAGNFFLAQYENAVSKCESVVGSALYVTCVTFIGLYLSWNCLQFLNHLKSERLLWATALRLCRCAPDHVSRNTLHELFGCKPVRLDDYACKRETSLLPMYFRYEK